ncbi:YcjF family protein [Colwellia sp. RSH04]|uniref:YcjF family protein n=1 Tax=Colwellia sp. RSH04 TaxID=2305464 RepID=UPI000E595063|nr:TIGR01620 family protein [Colwellia sp. RSH04]RHW75611.1 TIGR01620 family protein [Colwellia sp. RSH04]
MEKEQEKHQQQILFAETELETEEPKAPNFEFGSDNAEQLMFDNTDYLPQPILENELDELNNELLNQDIEAVEKNSIPWLWRIFILSLTVLVGVEAVNFFINGFEQSPIVTSLYAVILGCIGIAGSTSLYREVVGLSQFKRRQINKTTALSLLADKSNSVKDVESYCLEINQTLSCDLDAEQQRAWQSALDGSHNQAELLQLYSRIVLSKVDDKALNEVAKFSTEAVVLVGLSPVALIDMFIMLSRNLRMINKIAGMYGLKLGYWSRIKLIKQVFVNMAYAGASELVADLGSEVLGAELMGKLSTKFAQGLGAGMLTARLGVKTIQLCRPIPFDDKPKLGHVRKKVIEQLKGLIKP